VGGKFLGEFLGNALVELGDQLTAIRQAENPEVYQELTVLLNQHGIVNQQEVSARQLLNIAKAESKQVGAAAKQGLRAYTPREVAHQHLHDIILDVLKSRGVDVSKTDAMWRAWVPVRNLGLKLQTEQGPSRLISIVRGRNPVAAEVLWADGNYRRW